MNVDLSSLVAPESIAVIGASSDFSRIGGMLIKYLLKFGYKGDIYPVNPKYDNIAGLRCYPSVRDLPQDVDTGLIAVSERLVLDTLTHCAAQGIKTAIVYSAGFAETGEHGKRKQDELRQIIKQGGIRVCGPNCIGTINFIDSIAMSFTGCLESERLLPGNVGFVSQSGALGGSIVNRAQDRNLGFSYFISTGNEGDLDLADFMALLVDDQHTEVIMAYVEGIRDTEKFAKVAYQAAERDKPIILLKVGETDPGRKVAASHTGCLTGSHAVYSAAFAKYGVIQVEDYDDLIETTMLFSKSQLPEGKRVGILTGTGGGAIILADKISKCGLSIADLSEATKKELSQKVASFASVSNPLDLTGQLYSDPEMFKDVINIFALDENIDIVVAVISMVPGERARARAKCIIEAARTIDKPFVSWWAAGNLSEPAYRLLDESKVTLFKAPERCIRAIKSLVAYAQFKEKSKALKPGKEEKPQPSIDRDKVSAILASDGQGMTEHETKKLLCCYGIPVTREEVANSPEQAMEIAEKLGYPVVLKISSKEILHKSEIGGIKVNLNNKAEVARAYHEILLSSQKYAPGCEIEGVLVQEMVTGGTELIIGVSKDPAFGATIMFGLGGVFVEILKDISLRILPITRQDAEGMVQEIKGYKILEGVRGNPSADINAVIDLLLKTSTLMTDLCDSITELDLNPVAVFENGKGTKVVDALVVRKNLQLSNSS